MTAEDFNIPSRSKVQGTWNLHTNLPKGMDFFILLSSTSAVIGNRGQSNYASACTYQDALARHRVSLGEKCRSLNLGMVTEVGVVAEKQQLEDALKVAGYRGIKEAEFLALLEYLCDPALEIASPLDSQLVTGLVTLDSIRSKGLEGMFWMRKPMFRGLCQKGPAREGLAKDQTAISYETLLKAASSHAAAATIITAGLTKKLSKALSIPEEDVDAENPIYTLGADSLVAIDIRFWFLKEIKADITVFRILGNESMAVLCLLAAGKSGFVHIKETARDVDGGS